MKREIEAGPSVLNKNVSMNWTALVPAIAFFVAVGSPLAAWSVEIDERESGAASQLKPTLLRYDEVIEHSHDRK
jgi:hypothetical protein